MGRPRIYAKYEIPKGLVSVIVTLCADYKRRKAYVEKAGADTPAAVVKKYELINAAIEESLLFIEPELRAHIINDIAEGRGYVSSRAVNVSKDAYYRRRRKFISDVARALSLL